MPRMRVLNDVIRASGIIKRTLDESSPPFHRRTINTEELKMELKLLKENLTLKDADLIKDLHETAKGEPLSEHGPSMYFYDYIAYSGETVVIRNENKDSYLNCHILNVDEYDELRLAEYGWHLESLQDRTTLTLIIDSDDIPYNIFFVFPHHDEKGIEILKSFLIHGEIEILFLTIMHGKIYRSETKTFTLTENIISELKA